MPHHNVAETLSALRANPLKALAVFTRAGRARPHPGRRNHYAPKTPGAHDQK
jgi:hypothetical protein